MFKVLIAEDEILVRLVIRDTIDWNKFDMKVVADVENGQAAFEAYQAMKPDLILTDIKMPVMDGIKLVETIRKEDSRTKIIILSCVNEFEAARKALSLGVSDYILKLTMSQEEIESVLNKARNELMTNLLLTETGSSDLNPSISKASVIRDYLFKGTCPDDTFTELVADLKINLHPKNLVLCIMEIDHFEEMHQRSTEDQGRWHSILVNTVYEMLEGYQRGILCHEKDNRYVILFSFQDIKEGTEIRETLFNILSHIQRIVKSYFNASVTFGISDMHDDYPSVRNMYSESNYAISFKYFIEDKYVVAGDKNLGNIGIKVKSKLHQVITDLGIFNDEIMKDLDHKIDFYLNVSITSRLEAIKLLNKLSYWTLGSLNIKEHDVSELLCDYARKLELCENLDESMEVYKKYVKSVLDIKMKIRTYNREIAKVIKYIEENYSKKISLQMVAAVVEMSPTYICSLFKKEVNVNISEYIMQMRIEKAKDMLSNSNMKTYEIAERVGFSDESYFSRSFKKITGNWPNEFKKAVHMGDRLNGGDVYA